MQLNTETVFKPAGIGKNPDVRRFLLMKKQILVLGNTVTELTNRYCARPLEGRVHVTLRTLRAAIPTSRCAVCAYAAARAVKPGFCAEITTTYASHMSKHLEFCDGLYSWYGFVRRLLFCNDKSCIMGKEMYIFY